MDRFKLKPSQYYQVQGGSNGTHCRRCNEVLKGKTVQLYVNIREGTWHTTPQPDDNDEINDYPDDFGTACAKAALEGN